MSYNDFMGDSSWTTPTPYDTCGDLASSEFSESINTEWSVVLAFNSILYLSQVFFTLCLLGVQIWPPIGFIGFWGHFVGGCAHIAAIVLTGVYRYSDQG